MKCGCKRGYSEERHCVCLRNKLACTNACACSDYENEFLEKGFDCDNSSADEDDEITKNDLILNSTPEKRL